MSLALVQISVSDFQLIRRHLMTHRTPSGSLHRNMHLRMARQVALPRVGNAPIRHRSTLRYLHMLHAPTANGEIHGMISGPGVFWHYRVTATAAQTQVHVLTPPRSSAREAVRLQHRFLRDVLDRVHQEQSGDVHYPKRVDGEFYLLRQSPGMHVAHRHCQAAITTGALDRRFVEQIQAWNLALLRP
jgi:hypothetical protein